MRENHRLTENSKTNVPSAMITYDTETHPVDNGDGTKTHFLKVGVARYWQFERGKVKQEEIVFTKAKDFWGWVMRKVRPKKRLYLFAHNHAFDGQIVDMFGNLPNLGWRLEKHVIDSNIFIVKWTIGEHSCKKANIKGNLSTLTCLDTFNYFKTSIEAIGEKLGIPKLKIDFDHCTMEELTTYCKRDVEITEKILLVWFKFIKDNDLGNFQPTVASQAFSSFRHRFMNAPIFIHADENAIALERASYRGGRNEAFFIGQLHCPIHVLDFNSLYPSVMVDEVYPTNLLFYRKQNNLRTLKDEMYSNAIVARCKVSVDQPLIAVKKERLMFPIGTYEGVFTSPELRVLIERNCIREVKEISAYDETKIFAEYVKFFYDQRLKAKAEHDIMMDENSKLMLNSLYGKFGQRLKETRDVGESEKGAVFVKNMINGKEKDAKVERTKAFGGRLYVTESTKEESYNSFPAIASFCTSYARMKLLSAIETAGWENVYYCDTDSLFVNDDGMKKLGALIDPSKLGYLKVEYSAPDGMIIKGCKDYMINGKVKIKGIPKKARQIDESTFELTKFDKFNTSLQYGKINCVTERKMIKHLSRKYTKGTIGKGGFVEPFRMDE